MTHPIVIVGCTASGKSELAETLALKLGERAGSGPATIMAIDSMQVYRGMDIGTAKPSVETRRQIPHVMIDVADPWESYSAARFVAEARPILEAHVCQDKPIILVGGPFGSICVPLLEGLFLKARLADAALRAELEEEAARIGVSGLHTRSPPSTHWPPAAFTPNDLRRITRALEVWQLTGMPISELQTQWNRDHPAMAATFIGVHREKELLSRRINARVVQMVYPREGGLTLVEEVRQLPAQKPRGLSKEAAGGVGYRQLLDHFERKISLEGALEQIKIATRHLAKLQRTWLKRFSNVAWLDAGDRPAGDLVGDAEAIANEA